MARSSKSSRKPRPRTTIRTIAVTTRVAGDNLKPAVLTRHEDSKRTTDFTDEHGLGIGEWRLVSGI